eukprot:CAMPEP_0170632508 /NCGR_PEP_ID=MMETSP0224-20130122/35365_1 /TAXON_ID=285029 /ORGANISM="Togula jolla, Strain CCCM 725" /LENGTH=179 /DNA_ID=CAMNT_0010961225 /DNA_START=17 /DNA_END=553 /DNA_ORIENTATION=+
MTLKTTKVQGGKVWLSAEEKARERGQEIWPPLSWPTLCFLGLGPSSIEFLISLAQLFPELQLVLMEVEDASWIATLRSSLDSKGGSSRVQLGNIEDFAEHRGPARRSCQAISWSVDTPPFSFYRYRELFYSEPFILALFNFQGCSMETLTDHVDRYYCEYLHQSFQATLCGKISESKSA